MLLGAIYSNASLSFPRRNMSSFILPGVSVFVAIRNKIQQIHQADISLMNYCLAHREAHDYFYICSNHVRSPPHPHSARQEIAFDGVDEYENLFAAFAGPLHELMTLVECRSTHNDRIRQRWRYHEGGPSFNDDCYRAHLYSGYAMALQQLASRRDIRSIPLTFCQEYKSEHYSLASVFGDVKWPRDNNNNNNNNEDDDEDDDEDSMCPFSLQQKE